MSALPSSSVRLMDSVGYQVTDDTASQRGGVEASDPSVFGTYRGRIGHVGHQCIRRNLTEQPGLEVLHGLPQFGSRVHHEGPICLHRLADGSATEDQKLQGRTSRVLAVIT